MARATIVFLSICWLKLLPCRDQTIITYACRRPGPRGNFSVGAHSPQTTTVVFYGLVLVSGHARAGHRDNSGRSPGESGPLYLRPSYRTVHLRRLVGLRFF